MPNGKDMIIHSIAGLIKKMFNEIHHIKMSQYFPKPYEPFGGDINVKVDLSNYATKSDLKNATSIDTSKLAAKSDLVSLKAEVDKLNIDELKNALTDLSNLKSKVEKIDIDKLDTDKLDIDLSKLSNVVKNNVVKEIHIVLRSKILKIKYLILLT